MTVLGATCLPQVPPERLPEVARAAEDAGLAELRLWELADVALGLPPRAAPPLLCAATGLGRDGTAAVAGNAEQVAAAVRSWAAAGADTVVLHPDPAGQDPASQDPAAFVRFAAEQVQPLLG